MVRRRNIRFYRGEWKDILSLLFKGRFSTGGYVDLFESRFASYVGKKYAVATCSGRNGMELLFDAMGIGEGDEVIVPAYTLKDLLRLMEKKGIRPVLADVEKDTFNMDPVDVEKNITPRTKAVIATHMFGVPCDIERIMALAHGHGLKVIEDCAHAAGAVYDGKKVGSFGDAAFFSFEVTKPVNTFGGGMVVTDGSGIEGYLRAKIRKYPVSAIKVLKKILFASIENVVVKSPLFPLLVRLFTSGAGRKIYWAMHSGTRIEESKYSNVQAFVGLKQMEGLEAREAERARSAGRLTSLLAPGVVPQGVPGPAERVYYFYVVRTGCGGDIETARRRMLAEGIDAGILEEITDNCALLYDREDACPVAGELFGSNMQLPMYDGMKDKDIARIAQAVNGTCTRENEGR